MSDVNQLYAVPVLGFVAASGTGKTTLLVQLIPVLRKRGLRCGLVKHSHHDIEIDRPGKDSHRLREAGADQLILTSPHRTFWVQEGDGVSEQRLADLLGRFDKSNLDLILVEGFRNERLPKIEVHRAVLAAPLLCARDPDIIALASDDAVPEAPGNVVVLPLDRPAEVAEFIVAWLQANGRGEM